MSGTVTVTIRCTDTAAFGGEFGDGDDRNAEVARILQGVSDALRDRSVDLVHGVAYDLQDKDGNRVGQVEFRV